MVEPEAGAYLLDMMRDFGPVTTNGFGIVPKPDAEILAYFTGRGVKPEPWEFQTFRDMCRAYLSGLKSGEDKFSIAPMERG